MGKLSTLSPSAARTTKSLPVVCSGSPEPLQSGTSHFTAHLSFDDEIIDQYNAFVLDQFGVLHNGQKAMPGAIELVDYLANEKQKKLIILSNTSAPAHKALLKLPKLGFNPDNFVGMVTSGEEAARYIKSSFDHDENEKKAKAIFFTWDTTDPKSPRLTAMPQAFLDYCGNVEMATSVDEADFLLLHGSEVWCRGDSEQTKLDTFILDGEIGKETEHILQKCRERNLPCVCANPDVIVQNPDGSVNYMPGKIAQRYQALGGDVRIFGKPEPEHFHACLRTLNLPAHEVAHVGDSLHHDIAGAKSAGIAQIFVLGGIHLSQLDAKFGELPRRDSLDELFDEEGGIVPTHAVPAFCQGIN